MLMRLKKDFQQADPMLSYCRMTVCGFEQELAGGQRRLSSAFAVALLFPNPPSPFVRRSSQTATIIPTSRRRYLGKKAPLSLSLTGE